MDDTTQLVLDINVNKAYSQPRTSTPIHKFRVGGDGTSMVDLQIPLNAGQSYTLNNNFNMLILRTSGDLKLQALCLTYKEVSGVREYDTLTMDVKGFCVLTHPIQSVMLTNQGKTPVTLTLVGCSTQNASTTMRQGTGKQADPNARLVSSLTVGELNEMLEKTLKPKP